MSFVSRDHETHVLDVDAWRVLHRGGLCPRQRDAPADLHVREELPRRRLHDLLGFDEVGYVAILIGTTGVEATTHAVDATTGNQGEREGNRSSRQRRDDLHEAEDGDRNQVAREVLLERRQLLNRRVVEHEQRIHRRGEEVVFLRQSHTHAVYME